LKRFSYYVYCENEAIVCLFIKKLSNYFDKIGS
jgi:hypothetical protein